MKEIIVATIVASVVSLVISIVINRRAAAYTLEVIDGYVEDVMEKIKELVKHACELIRDAYSDK